jgi:dienelactone hydrolase
MSVFRWCGVVALALLAGAAGAAAGDAEVARTWAGGLIAYPDGGAATIAPIESGVAAAAAALKGRRLPGIVYLHGCSGIDEISRGAASAFAAAGFVVALPDSFRRADKPTSCDVASHAGSLHRGVLAWRHDEARHALAEIRALPFVDSRNLFLVGFSEGAIATATMRGASVNARIVEGWTCHALWPEYAGLAGGSPVLTLTSVDDPWFQDRSLRGDCGALIKRRDGSRSIVFSSPDPLHDQHYVSWRADVRATILNFLRAHMR